MNIKIKMRKVFSSIIVTLMSVSMLTEIPVSAEIGKTMYNYDGYAVEYSVTNEWDGTQTVEVTISNTGSSSILNWSLKYDAEGEISNLWNAEIYKQGTDEYVIKNANWNYKIDPGQSVTYGYTLNGSDYSSPNSFEMNSKKIEMTEGYSAQLNIKNEWATGVEGEIILTNTSDTPLEAWTLSFDSNFVITNLWNAEITNDNNGHYAISSVLWTNSIPSGGFISIGFTGEKEIEIDSSISNFSLMSIVVDDEEDVLLPDLNTDVIDLGYIEDLIFAEVIDVIQDNDGNIRTIDGKFTNKSVHSVEDAIHILNCASTLFGNKFNANNGEIFVQISGDEIFYRYSPSINGIPVMGNQIVLASKNGEVTGLFSTYDNQIENVNTVSQISDVEAADIAIDDIINTYPELIDSLVIESGLTNDEVESILRDSLTISSTLVVYSGVKEPAKLAWKISLKNEYTYDFDGDDETFIDLENIYDYGKYILSFVNSNYFISAYGNDIGNIIYIDDVMREWTSTTANATDLLGVNRIINVECGDVTDNYRMIDNERNIKTYTTQFIAGLPQVPGKIVMTTANNWTNSAAVSVHANLAEVYDFYNDVLGWKSFDNNGTAIKASISYKKKEVEDYNNACWNGSYQQFMFGNLGNFEAALDIVGHEYTHAVIDNKVYDSSGIGLTYYGETGALEESYADILGSIIEGKTTSDKWLIGEDTSMTLRSMQQPSIYNQPEHYTNLYKGSSDKGGVHKNSGIFNYAAYKMMTDGRTASISNDTWAKVYFGSMNRLTTSSLFIDARGAILSSAKSLGFSQSEQQAIKDAFDDVGICEPNTVRIVLRWGATPNDLDSHLTGPAVNGNGRFHVYYGARNYYNDGTYGSSSELYAADLDYDDTSAFGPEVTSIRTLTAGDYYFYVYDFSNQRDSGSVALSNSGANVTIYKGASNTALKLSNGKSANFVIKSGNPGNLWSVCRITIDLSGNVTITPIDSISYHTGGSGSVGS